MDSNCVSQFADLVGCTSDSTLSVTDILDLVLAASLEAPCVSIYTAAISSDYIIQIKFIDCKTTRLEVNASIPLYDITLCHAYPKNTPKYRMDDVIDVLDNLLDMTQSRRPSTTKHTTKQSPTTDHTPSIKEALQAAGFAMTTPVKTPRHPPIPHSIDMGGIKVHPKESPTKRDKQSEIDNPPKDPISDMARITDKAVLHVTTETFYPGNRINVVISLPKTVESKWEMKLKPLFSSESDHLESTMKGDLQFLHHDPDVNESDNSSTTTTPPKPNENVLDVSSNVPSPFHISHQSFPEWDKLGSYDPEIAAIPLHSHDIPNDHLSSFTETEHLSPTLSTVVPRAPPTTPGTPKREIKLITREVVLLIGSHTDLSVSH